MVRDLRIPVIPALASDLKALADAAKNLNSFSDQLTQQVEQIESVINALNLGLRATVVVEADGDGDLAGLWTHYTRLLYDKVDGRWGLAIDEYDEDVRDEETKHNYKIWAFCDSPRGSRLKVVDKIPELIKVLLKESQAMTLRVGQKLEEVNSIASNLFAPALDGEVRK